MENDAPVVGPDALTANFKMNKLDTATGTPKSASVRLARYTGAIFKEPPKHCGVNQKFRANYYAEFNSISA
jgi:hypothetical protein